MVIVVGVLIYVCFSLSAKFVSKIERGHNARENI
jgi:hypothetical protein